MANENDDADYLGERWREAGALAGLEPEIHQGPGLFLASVGTLVVAAGGTAALAWYLAVPRFAQWAAFLPTLALALAAAFFAYLVLEFAALVATVYGGRDLLLPLARGRRAAFRVTPWAKRVARLLGAGGDRLLHSFVEVSNAAQRAQTRRLTEGQAGPVLLLLPRCLQRTQCDRPIADDVDACSRCGACPMAEILALRDEYGGDVVAAVLTGGSLAPGLIRRLEPRAVVGVACERELFDGIAAVGARAVLGVANRRPEGPCRATLVDIDELREAVATFARTPRRY